MSNVNLTAQRQKFEEMIERPLVSEMLRQEGQFLFAHDRNGNEWSVKVSTSGKIKKNSLRRES
jgi:phage pi2 protein 07